MKRATQYADNLTEALDAAGINRQQLVVELGQLGCPVSLQAVGGWLRGEYAPSTRHQAAVAKVLRIPPHLLFPITLEMAA